MVYFVEGTSDYLGRVIGSDEIFGHFSALMSKCLLCATNAFKSEELTIRYAIPAVAGVCAVIAQVIVAVCRFSIQISLYVV